MVAFLELASVKGLLIATGNGKRESAIYYLEESDLTNRYCLKGDIKWPKLNLSQ